MEVSAFFSQFGPLGPQVGYRSGLLLEIYCSSEIEADVIVITDIINSY